MFSVWIKELNFELSHWIKQVGWFKQDACLLKMLLDMSSAPTTSEEHDSWNLKIWDTTPLRRVRIFSLSMVRIELTTFLSSLLVPVFPSCVQTFQVQASFGWEDTLNVHNSWLSASFVLYFLKALSAQIIWLQRGNTIHLVSKSLWQR